MRNFHVRARARLDQWERRNARRPRQSEAPQRSDHTVVSWVEKRTCTIYPLGKEAFFSAYVWLTSKKEKSLFDNVSYTSRENWYSNFDSWSIFPWKFWGELHYFRVLEWPSEQKVYVDNIFLWLLRLFCVHVTYFFLLSFPLSVANFCYFVSSLYARV